MSYLETADLRYDERGLVTVVAQDVATGAVLMVAWANREALDRTNETGLAWFWSRSRGRLWQKGESSGHSLRVVEARVDCDRDTVLLRVHPQGPACHLGTRTCFEPNPARLELGWLAEVITGRRGADPASSYTARLLAEGPAKIGKKVGEEAVEVVVAGLAPAASEAGVPVPRDSLLWESADLLYHLLVLLAARGEDPAVLAAELARRHAAAGRSAEELP